ncbi:MAG: tetratricopeptide repeat protein [Spirochaetota bacterium]
MLLIVGIFLVVIFILIFAVYFYRQMSYSEWLKTDDGVLQALQTRLQRDPKDLNALRQAGAIFYKKGNFEKSFEHYSRMIVQIGPDIRKNYGVEERFQIYLEFGIAAYNIRKFDDAIISLQKARTTIPNAMDLQLSLILGRLLYKKRQFAGALIELENAHKLKKNDNSNNFYLGMCYVNLGRFKEALPLLEPLEIKYSEDPRFMLGLANCYDKTGDPERALKYYDLVADDDTVGAVACYNAAAVRLLDNKTDEALACLKKSLEKDNPPGDLSYRSLYDSAKIYVKLGKLADACSSLQQLCDLNNGYRDAKVLLKNYQEMAKNYNLYLIYYGEKDQRSYVMRNLLQQLIPGIRHIENETYRKQTMEVVVNSLDRQEEFNYYVWVNLRNETISLDKIYELLNRGKRAGCSRYILIGSENFDAKAKEFSEMRSIDIIEGPAFREKLLKIS